MRIGVPKEVKAHEYRVAVTPEGVCELVAAGHEVICEAGLGIGSGFPDREYAEAGAVMGSKQDAFGGVDLVVKVKEPVPEEYGFLTHETAIFTYLHLAPNRPLTAALLASRVRAFAYETLEYGGVLPLLVPMSEIAGRIAVLVGAHYLQRTYGGSGVLPAGAPGVPPASAAIIGAGAVGTNAARAALALGMHVAVLNRGMQRLHHLDELFMGRIDTLPSNKENIVRCLRSADMVVGAVYVKGERAPRVVTRAMLGLMKPGSVLVDVAIDQGGCFETSHPTTHDDPVYLVDGIVHYAVANMPGAYPRTSALALANATLPYIMKLASLGIADAVRDAALRSALNTWDGSIAHAGLAASTGLPLGGPG